MKPWFSLFLRRMLQIRRNFLMTCTISGMRAKRRKADTIYYGRSAENGADKVLSRGEENSSVHMTYVNFLKPRKSALDVPLYASSSGRSMVEMLGVLAIIGVLSVGAIAGYSKTMMKYKLNKQAEAINLLLNNAIQNTKRFQNNSTSDKPEMYAQIMDKLGLLPDGIELSSSNATYLTDKMFGNSLWIFAYPSKYGMGYEFSRHGDKKEICRNLLNVYKANSSELYYVFSDRHYQPDEGYSSEENFSQSGSYYGDAYCKEGNNCLRSISLNDIGLLCHQCAEDSTQCRFYAIWK